MMPGRFSPWFLLLQSKCFFSQFLVMLFSGFVVRGDLLDELLTFTWRLVNDYGAALGSRADLGFSSWERVP